MDIIIMIITKVVYHVLVDVRLVSYINVQHVMLDILIKMDNVFVVQI